MKKYIIFILVLISSLFTTNIALSKINKENNSEETQTLAIANNYLKSKIFNKFKVNNLLVVRSDKQKMYHFKRGTALKSYPISTSKRGLGQVSGSKQTPKGLHRINQKIGATAPKDAVFKARQYIGKQWQELVPTANTKNRRDFIVTRVLRLEGLEEGLNKGKDESGKSIDSQERNIYIHGTTYDWMLGQPASIGCVHMNSDDIISMFDTVDTDTFVLII